MNALAPARRLALAVIFLTALAASSIPAGAFGQELQGCEGYSSQGIAQAMLDIIPESGDVLDPDGNGVACDHEGNEEGSGGDAVAYLAGIQDELDTVAASLERYAEIDASYGDASAAEQRDMVDEILEIADFWAGYPDEAAEFEAPEGYEDVEDAYLDCAEAVGEAGELWLVWWDIPSGDADEDPAYDAFEDAYGAAWDDADTVQIMLDDAGGSNGPTDGPTDEPANEVSSYLDDVSEHADSLNADLATFSNGGETITQQEIDRIFENFTDAPDVAADIDVPDGYDDVQDAYVDFTHQLALIPDLYGAWVEGGMSASFDDPLDDPLLTELVFATNDAYDLHETLTAVIEEFESAATSGTDAPAASDDPYLAYVRETAEALNADTTTFLEMMLPTNPADPKEMERILTNWIEMPASIDIAVQDVPVEYADIHDAFETYTNDLAAAARYFMDWLEAGNGPGRDDAFANLMDAFESAREHYAALDALLIDAGA